MIGRVWAIDVGIGDGEVLEGEAGTIGRIKAPNRAVTSALIAEGILNQDRAGRVRWIIVDADVTIALIPGRMMAQIP